MKVIIVFGFLLFCGLCTGDLFLGPASADGSTDVEDFAEVHFDQYSGNWIYAGTFSDSVFNAWGGSTSYGATDGFITAYNGTTGSRIWAVTFGTSAPETVGGIAIAAQGNIVVVGFTAASASSTFYWTGGATTPVMNSNDFFIGQYNSSGGYMWGGVYGGTGNEMGASVVYATFDGYIHITGSFTQSFTTVGGVTFSSVKSNTPDIFVAKVDPSSGTIINGATFGGSGMDEPNRLIESPDLELVIVGYYTSNDLTFTIGGTPLTLPGPTNPYKSALILKLSAFDFSVTWASSASSSTGDAVANDAVVLNLSSQFVIVGYCFGNLMFNGTVFSGTGSNQAGWLLDVDWQQNSLVWGKMMQGAGPSSALSVDVGSADTIYVTGNYPPGTSNFSAGGADLPIANGSNYAMFVAAYNNDIHKWSTGFGASGEMQGKAVGAQGTSLAYGATFKGTANVQNFTAQQVANSTPGTLDLAFLFFSDVPPSPSPTPSATCSPTASITPSVSSTPSASKTPSGSVSASPTPSRTPTVTPSISVSSSMTPSASPTPSISVSPSPTSSISVSPSPSVGTMYTTITVQLGGNQSDFNGTQFLDEIATVLGFWPKTDVMEVLSVNSKSTSYHVVFNIYDVSQVDSAYEAGNLVTLVNSNSTLLIRNNLIILSISVDYSHAAHKPSPSNTASGKSSAKSETIIIAAVVSAGGLGTAIAITAFLVKRRKVKKDSDVEMLPRMSDMPSHEESHMTSEGSRQEENTVTPQKKKKDKWEIEYEDLTIESELGRGAFGVVYLAKWRKVAVVVKQLDVSQGASAADFIKEANNVKDMRPHPNICSVLGVCLAPEHPICIVMEYVPYGSLWGMVTDKKISMNQDLLLDFAMDVASGMSHLHKENIIHCDLACRNLLVAPKQGGKYSIKITDFGLARVTEQDLYNASTNAMFPVRWTAPETIRGRIISRASDVWSFGVTVWEMAAGKQPYPNLTNPQVIVAVCDKGVRLPKPDVFPVHDELYDLMMTCWNDDPKERPSFDSICASLAAMDKKIRGNSTFSDFSETTSHKEGYASTSTSQDTTSHARSYGTSMDDPVPQPSKSDNSNPPEVFYSDQGK